MPWPKGTPRDKPGQEHSLKNRFRADPRTEAQRRAEGGGRHGHGQLRNREYYCTCGVSFGNVIEVNARKAWRAHRKQVGAD